jgi:predicted metal-dependent hydrolase
MQTKDELMRDFDYKIIRSLRSRSIRISISPNCEIKVIASHFIPEFFIHDFVSRKADWIKYKLVKFRKNPISKERIFLHSLKKKDFLQLSL